MMGELEELQSLLHQPLEEEYLPEIKDWFLSILRRDILANIGPSFWELISSNTEQSEEEDVSGFVSAMNVLFAKLRPYMDVADHLSKKRELFEEMKPSDDATGFQVKVQTVIRALLLHRTTAKFQSCVQGFYRKAFWSFHGNKPSNSSTILNNSDGAISNSSDVKMDETLDEEENSVWETKGTGDNIMEGYGSNITEHFHRINKNLYTTGLLERVCGEAVTSIIHVRIEEFVEERCKGEFEQSFIKDLEQWLNTQVMGWLRTIFDGDQGETSSGQSSSQTLSKWNERLTYFLYQTYAKLRIRELFNIIVEYPDSHPALEDLKESLRKTDLRSRLIQSLRVAMETRLLHPGVNTSDILTQYVSSIRALQVLDSTGVILELVCEPVRSYLRTRDDTVRCIVSSLTDEGNSDLADELAKSNPLNIHEGQGADDGEEEGDPFKWEPDPVDADPGQKLSSQRSSDILSMLVNIYGSRELFVNEYRSLLADRILTHFNFDTDREVRNLELLKLRFGESQLHHCEVMLKDVADSRRCNANIKSAKGGKKDVDDKENKEETQEQEEEDENVDDDLPDGGKRENLDFKAMILSAQFWPNLKEEKLSLHSKVQTQLDKYTKSYEALKATRTLFWKPNLGQVTLELELKDRTVSLAVSPLHATIIMHFEEKEKWTIQELSGVMQVPSTTLRRKIAFWQSQGLLKEDPTDCFTLVEEDSGRGSKEGADEVIIESDDETESATASTQSQTLHVFWSYIEGMLTNLNSLPIERIHAMLKMFAMPGPATSEISEHELKLFLDKKVKEQELIFSGGFYKLPKADGQL
ncbi:anaphase-promoting complex subunit 2-like [Apostichopus japonicus]|uniref:anaphase-promoting complex subunit 2-like n=1 Tax=Stichopus japonicus TaxID=307972 RepID=UPI003AB5174B